MTSDNCREQRISPLARLLRLFTLWIRCQPRSSQLLPKRDIDAERLVIHLGHRDEHSAAGKKRHEFNEHITSFSWHRR